MIYLDHAATSWPKPRCVIDAMARFLAEDAGSPGRGGHRMSVAAGRVVNETRNQLARLFHASDPKRIIHCLNCTDALNMAIKGCLREGDHVVCTALDHNSVSRPIEGLARRGWIGRTRVSVGMDSLIDPDEIRRSITPRTRLIAMPHASNVTGVIQPIRDVGRIARERDLLLLIDVAQTAGVLDIHVEDLQVDLVAGAGHKALHGPPGTGMLYVGPRVELSSWREGGTGQDSANPTQPTELPTLLEAGTPNAVGIAGLGAALAVLDAPKTLAHVTALVDRMRRSLDDHNRVHIIGRTGSSEAVGVVSVVLDGVAPADATAILDHSFDIATRGDLHCAPYTHRALATAPEGTIRVSPGPSTTEAEIDTLVGALLEIASMEKGV